VSVLKLSVMWGFQAIARLATGQVFRRDVVDPLTKVLLARDYGLSEQLLPSLSLYTRQGIVKAEDADALGLDYFLKILEVQERMIPAASNRQIPDDSHTNELGLHNRKNCNFTETLQSNFREVIHRWDFNALVRSGPVSPIPASPPGPWHMTPDWNETSHPPWPASTRRSSPSPVNPSSTSPSPTSPGPASPSPAPPVQLEDPEKDDRFFPVDVYFLVSWHRFCWYVYVAHKPSS
jgi:hypothetical protein